MQHRTTLIACTLITLVAVGLAGLSIYMSAPRQASAAPENADLESRVAALEQKLANLERFMQVSLDNEAQLERMIDKRDSSHSRAKVSSLMSQLQTVRSQLELYQVQHNGNYPNLLNGWAQLTRTTDAAGRVGAQPQYGPYLQQPATNPFTESSQVVRPDDASKDAGWAYDPATGSIRPVLPPDAAKNFDWGTADYVTY